MHDSKVACIIYIYNLSISIVENVPLESREVATMFLAVPNALAKQSENEKSPSPTSKISSELR